MALILQSIEHHFPGELIDLGRSLFEKNAVGSLTEVEKHLWTGIISEERDYEVEVQITPTKVKAFTCECETFRKDRICKHVIAFLIALRQVKAEKKSNHTAQKQPERKQTYRKLSVNAVLKNVSEEALKDFVKTYARSNRPFSLALKAGFINQVPLEDSHKKYADLIRATVRSNNLAKKRLSPSSRKRLRWLLDRLEDHWETAFSERDYREALAITLATFTYLFPLRFKEMDETRSIELVDRLAFCFRWLIELIDSEMAPKLKEEIALFLKEQFERTDWLLIAQQDEYLEVLLAAVTPNVRNNVWTGIQPILSGHRMPNKSQLQVVITLLRRFPQKEWPEFCLSWLHHTSMLDALLKELQLPEDKQLLLQLANIGLSCEASKGFHLRMREYLLEIALLDENIPVILDLAESLFLATGDPAHYRTMLPVIAEDANHLEDILEKVANQPAPVSSPLTIARIYILEQHWEMLLRLLEQEAQLDLLLRLEKELPGHLWNELFPIYEKALRKYLGSYLGKPAARKIEQLFQHLYRLKAHSVGRRLKSIIQRDFKEWKAVQQTLAGYQL